MKRHYFATARTLLAQLLFLVVLAFAWLLTGAVEDMLLILEHARPWLHMLRSHAETLAQRLPVGVAQRPDGIDDPVYRRWQPAARRAQ